VQLSLFTKIGITAIINKLLEMFVKQAEKAVLLQKAFNYGFPWRPKARKSV
jgi:hypothetical protein